MLLAALLLSSPALAVEYEYGLEIGAGATDNIARTPDNEISETILTAGVDALIRREGHRVDVDLDADLAYFDYRDGTFDSEVVGTMFADIRARLVPDRLAWLVTDTFGQLSLDPFAAVSPANRENVNYFITGPDLTMPVGDRGSVTASGRYAMSTHEESNLDDERLMAGIAFGRELAPGNAVSLNATFERIEFDDTNFTANNYDRQSTFVRYTVDGARTRLRADAGYSSVRIEGGDSGSPLIDVEVSRDLSPRSILTLRAGMRSADSASALFALNELNALGACSPSSSGQTASPDPYESTFGTVCWEFSGRRTSFFLSASLERDEYETRTELDRGRRVFQASFERQIAPRFSVGLQGWMYRADFDTVDQIDDETRLGLYLTWNIVGRLFLELDGEAFERDSTNALSNFEENRAFIRLAWRDQDDPPTVQ
jgi:hypothetical protein